MCSHAVSYRARKIRYILSFLKLDGKHTEIWPLGSWHFERILSVSYAHVVVVILDFYFYAYFDGYF